MRGREAPGWALVILTGLNLCNYLDRYILPAVLAPLEKDLAMTDSQFGTVATIFMVGYFATSPFFGYLGDRLARRWLIAGGVAVWCLGTVLCGFAHGVASLICFRILVGVGEASYGTIAPGWIADLFSQAKRNWALSVFYVAIPVGTALGYLLGGAVAAHFGWRAAFLMAGAPGLLFAIGLLFLREPPRGAQDVERPAPPVRAAAGGGYARLLSYPIYWLVVAGYAAQTFAMGGFANWAAEFLRRNHRMSFATADGFFGLAVVATGLVATLAGGAIGTAWEKRGPGGYARLLAVSALAAVPFTYAAFVVPSLSLAKASLVGAMFLLFLSTGPVNTLILETVPVAMRASAMAASIFCIHLFGDLWSPKIVGWLSTRSGDLRQAILWTLPPAVVVCAVCWTALAWHSGQRRQQRVGAS